MSTLKEVARYVLYWVKKKDYKLWIHPQTKIKTIYSGTNDEESFFGYYDHSPEAEKKIVYHLINGNEVEIHVKKLSSGQDFIIGKSKAFNWQMGARVLWIDQDILSWNDFNGKKYICKWYSLSKGCVMKTFDYPLLDNYKRDYYLSVNFQRLRSYAKEYAYYCLPELSNTEYEKYNNDGIWKINAKNEETSLLLSIADILKCDYSLLFDKGHHFVNHIMISPSGKAFIFIHRYYVNGTRYDRLMYYDFHQLQCLLNGKTQSHFCWINDNQVFGYGEYQGRLGFYSINIDTLSIKYHKELTTKHPKDGHPTYYGKWVIIDSYPDLSRMQSLIAYNIETGEIIKIGDFFHDLQHKGFTRCDLHPRFSDDGQSVYIDTIYTGKRQLCKIELNGILS